MNSASTSGSAQIHMLGLPMRRILVPSVALSGIAAVVLFVFPGRTHRLFAWTLRPELSAMVMGGGYAAGSLLTVLTFRRVPWAVTRVAAYSITLFATAIAVATLLHLDRMHFDSNLASARFAAWVWLIVYIVAPPGLAALIIYEYRQPGIDPPREASLGRGLKTTLGIQGGVMMAVGVALFVIPLTMARVWPWAITPLSARAIGSWFMGIGFAGAWSVVEDDVARLRPAAITYTVLGVAWSIAVVRASDEVEWERVASWLFVLGIASIVVAGAIGWKRTTSHGDPTGARHPV
jgi:hypothetical protein